MNQTFSFSRFRLMLRWELATKGQSYLLTAVPLLAFMLLMMLPMAFATEYNGNLSGLQYAALFLPVLLGGSLYTNQAFSQYSARDTGMAALMVPASRLEKVLSALLMNLGFVVPFVLLFLFLHDWTVNVANSKLPVGTKPYEKIDPEILRPLIVLFVMIQGFLFLGSLYFTKASYVKTLAIFIVVAGVLIQVNNSFAEYLMGGDYFLNTLPFSSWRFRYGKVPIYQDYQEVQHIPLIQDLTYLLPFLVLLALWYITYVRLGEKEI